MPAPRSRFSWRKRRNRGPRITSRKARHAARRRVVIVKGDAQQHALQDVVW